MPKRTRSPSSESEESAPDLLPEASKERYKSVFEEFLKSSKIKRYNNGKLSRKAQEHDYSRFLSAKKADGFKASTLWSYYSMLNSCSQTEWGFDLKGEFPRLTLLLKKWGKGHVRKKAKVFTDTEIEKFLNLPVEIKGERELKMRKAALVLSLSGGLRCCELRALSVGDLEEDDDGYMVTYRGAKQRGEEEVRKFRVLKASGYSAYVKEHLRLMTLDKQTEGPLFRSLNRDRTKFTANAMGKNYLYEITKHIATALDLAEPDRFTSHALRRSAATRAAENGASDAQLKRHFGWKNSQTANRYIESTKRAATEMANLLQPAAPSMAAPCAQLPAVPVAPVASSHEINIRLTLDIRHDGVSSCKCKQ